MQNAITWFEIPVTDMTRALTFYQTLTGQAMSREAFGPPGGEMATFPVKEHDAVTGCLQFDPHSQPSQEGSLVYLNAAPSIGAWIDRAEQAGGKIIVPKTALPPGMGFFAIFIDCEGNRVGLHALA